MGRRRGRTVKRNHATREASKGEDASLAEAPHSFVVHRGSKVGKPIQDLTLDFRRVMEPFTASNVKVRSKNVVKDFSAVAGLLKVSHLIAFTRTDKHPYLKLGRFPRGPTMTFRIRDYVLARDVRSSLKKQVTYETQFSHHALLIMNNFTGNKLESTDDKPGIIPLGSREMELMTSVFQNMFPSIDVTRLKLNELRRCVLLNFNSETGCVDFRHYTIKVSPVGASRGLKKIISQAKVPNLSRYGNVSEYFENAGAGSESEAEGDEASHVTLPQALSSRGNIPNQQSSIKLVELGPRLTLEPMKIEEGLLDGEVLYHRLQVKTAEQKEKIRLARKKRQSEKERRRKDQEKNIKRKEMEKKAAKEKSLVGMGKINKRSDLPDGFKNAPDSSEDDNDAEWYRKEVGQNPEKDLFDDKDRRKRKASFGLSSKMNKRFKKTETKSVSSKNNEGFRKKSKRPKDIFNSQGVGPKFNKSAVNKGPRVNSVKRLSGRKQR